VVEDIPSFDENDVLKAELLCLSLLRSRNFAVFARPHCPKMRCCHKFAYFAAYFCGWGKEDETIDADQ
jgi:hypothetical protein